MSRKAPKFERLTEDPMKTLSKEWSEFMADKERWKEGMAYLGTYSYIADGDDPDATFRGERVFKRKHFVCICVFPTPVYVPKFSPEIGALSWGWLADENGRLYSTFDVTDVKEVGPVRRRGD